MEGKRLAWILGAFVALYAAARLSGIDDLVSRESIRGIVSGAGGWGQLAFIGVFVLGVVAQIPGMVFVTASPFLFPAVEAWWLSLVAGNLAVNLNFALVRRVGGRRELKLRQRWAQRLLGQLERRPLRAVFALRMALAMLPPLTAALALTRLSAREHLVASALGLAFPISVYLWLAALFAD